MKASLQLTSSQRQALTPQLQQSLHLLQLSSMDLETEIQAQLECNPLLELDEPTIEDQALQTDSSGIDDRYIPEPISESEDPGNEIERSDHLKEECDIASQIAESFAHQSTLRTNDESHLRSLDCLSQSTYEETLAEHLLRQLQLTRLNDLDKLIGLSLIHNLDEDGYLTLSLEEIARDVSNQIDQEIGDDEVSAVLSLIRTFSPQGVAAYDLRDRLQILFKDSEFALRDKQHYLIAQQILELHFDFLVKRDFHALEKRLKVNRETLTAAVKLITSLNPRISGRYGSNQPDHITPDVIVNQKNGRWYVTLNAQNRRSVSVNPSYATLADASANNQTQTAEYIRRHLSEANLFIRGLNNRYSTLLLVAQAIVARQQPFFEQGETEMRPMVLQDIAKELKLHESTISRATAGKYLLSPSGVFELKYFFSNATETIDGVGASSTAVRSIIKSLIAAENKSKPLSDNKITKELETRGHALARRTVAKYRESLNIAPSSQRKALI